MKSSTKDNAKGKLHQAKAYQMKPTRRSIIFILATLAVAVVSISGCALTGMQRSEETSITMEAVDNDIKLIVAQLDATGASLDELIRSGQSDVKKAFDLYSDNVSKLEEMEKDFSKNAEEMKAQGIDYFAEWKKDGEAYTNPKIQELSEQRRMELAEIYGKIQTNSIGVKKAFRTYVSDSEEIQMYLSNDLTTKGIEAIAPIANRTTADGDNLKTEIQKLEMAIETARSEMSQSGR